MALKTTLTNERLNNRFENPFALVNYAISLAKVNMERGDGIHNSNPVNEVLETIATNRDKIEDIEDEEEIEIKEAV